MTRPDYTDEPTLLNALGLTLGLAAGAVTIVVTLLLMAGTS